MLKSLFKVLFVAAFSAGFAGVAQSQTCLSSGTKTVPVGASGLEIPFDSNNTVAGQSADVAVSQIVVPTGGVVVVRVYPMFSDGSTGVFTFPNSNIAFNISGTNTITTTNSLTTKTGLEIAGIKIVATNNGGGSTPDVSSITVSGLTVTGSSCTATATGLAPAVSQISASQAFRAPIQTDAPGYKIILNLASGYIVQTSPLASDFTVSVNGSPVSIANLSGNVATSTSININLQNVVSSSDVITLAYTKGAFQLKDSSAVISDLASFSAISVTNNRASTPPPPPTDAIASAAQKAIVSDIQRATVTTLSGNSRMMTMALGRFANDQNAGVVTRNSENILTGLRLEGFNLVANGEGIDASGRMSFLDTSNGWRRVGYADMNAVEEQGVGHTVSINGRFSWERSLNDTTLSGYFVGADLQQSKIKGSLSGDQDGLALLAGTYAIHQLENGLIASGYGALGFNRRNLSLEDGASTIKDKYNTKNLMLGGIVSGDVDMGSYRLRPSIAANYSVTYIGDLSLTQTTSGTTSALAVSPGTVSYIDLIATPEFAFDVKPLLTGQASAELTLAPRLTCEQRKADTTNRVCGSGVSLGMSSLSRDGATILNAKLSLDKIGGVMRRGLQLQVQMDF